MPKNISQLRLDGLTSLQLAELRAVVATTAGDCITAVDNTKLSGGKVGEPTLISVVITLGPSVISAVALWLAKQKKGRTKKIIYSRIDPNGGTESFEMDESSYDEGESPSAAIQTFLERKLGHDDPAAS
jgi:hypothetical protein